MTLRLSGIFSALVTPVDEEGRVSSEALREIVDFVISRGVAGICIGGATSEYVHYDLAERKQIITRVAEAAAGRVPLISAIGASTFDRVLALARHSAESGCNALLVPTPHFYRYEERDFETFFRKVFSAAPLPCLIYDLPQFSNPVQTETIQRLLLTAQNVVGLKDSTGQTAHLSRLAMAREQGDFSLFVGDDQLIYSGLAAGWDGAISGVACLCPEILVRLYNEFRKGDRTKAKQYQETLNELLEELSKLPFPWGIRVGLGVRGIPTGGLPLPLSPHRRQQINRFREWLPGWLQRNRL
ncbi:MAG TPA: dihydrodipicolinate synthase family protein [Acidobacteriota bacterium]|nr:dihydrodipicolinate synthase family protein [Acidobacteriota bacterium]